MKIDSIFDIGGRLGAATWLVAGALMAFPGETSAQVATSANYSISGLVLDSGGGGTCSIDSAAWISVGALSSQGEASASFA